MKPKIPQISLARAFFGALLASASICLTSTAQIPDSQLPVAGMNLHTNTDWAPVIYWNNIANGASKWTNATPTNLPLDANGWPTSLNGSTTVNLIVGSFKIQGLPAGNYVLTWEGDGDLNLTSTGSGASQPVLSSGSAALRRKVYTITPNANNAFLYIRWVSTSAAPNNVKNVKLWLPGKENSPNLINDTVASEMAPFEVLRMMDWGETNGNEFVNWSDRPKVNGPVKRPVPYETMIAVCNELDKDLWICVPAKASDDFVTQLATLIRDNLEPGLYCWIEYSNEIWNFNFTQSTYVNTTAGFPGANLDQKYAYRAGQVFNIFYNVFGSQASSRLMRVAATQAANASRAQNRLAALGSNVDVLALTNYFGGGNSNNAVKWIATNWNNGALTYAQYRDYLKTTDIDNRLVAHWISNINHATNAGVPAITYEGGQHLTDEGAGLTTAQMDWLLGFQRSTEMGETLRYVLDKWTALGGKTHVAFTNYSTFASGGSWGHKEFSGQSESAAPKWAALMDWIEVNTDDTAPVLSIPSNITAEATSSTGATVSFTVSATDNVSGAVTATASPASGSTFALGNTTVNVTASDAAGNVANGSFVVTVRDTTAPTLTYPSDQSATATSFSGVAVTYSVSASDAVSGSITPTVSKASGSTFAPGLTTVTVSASDSAGNAANASFNVTVTGTVTETFTDSTFPTAFGSGSFTGVDGLSWSYAGVKAFTLNSSKTAWIRNNGLGSVSASPAVAVKSVSLKHRSKTTTQSQLELLVGGTVVATSALQGTTQVTWTVTGLTGAAGATIQIRSKGTGEPVVDDVEIGF